MNTNKNIRLIREIGHNTHNNDNGLIYNNIKQFFISFHVVGVVCVVNVVVFVKKTPALV